MIVTLPQLLERRSAWREAGQQVVFTNGCFDLIHLGHVLYLSEARALGDVLVVGLNSDDSVRQLKGAQRPLVPAPERAEVMDALKSVDFVAIFEELTANNIIAALQPDIYVKGGDYTIAQAGAYQGKPLPEAPTVQAYGGQIQLIPFLPHHSTTELIQKILATFSQ